MSESRSPQAVSAHERASARNKKKKENPQNPKSEDHGWHRHYSPPGSKLYTLHRFNRCSLDSQPEDTRVSVFVYRAQGCLCRANMAHKRQPRPDSGLGLLQKIFQVVPFLLGSNKHLKEGETDTNLEEGNAGAGHDLPGPRDREARRPASMFWS